MFSQKLLLPALAVFTTVAAQSPTICSQPTATINSQGDAAQFASCTNVAGSIIIGSTASGAITLDGPITIGGDLTINNSSGITSFGSSSIAQIKGTFNLQALTILSSVQMSVLTAVKGINFVSVPNLSALGFTSVVTSASSVTVSNTGLTSFDGLDLATVGTLQVDNNVRLVDFSSNVGNISVAAVFNGNGANLAVSFPQLKWAENITFRDVGTVNLNALQVVNGSLGFLESSVSSISCPNLTAVGNYATGIGGLTFVQNTALTNISMDSLKSVGGANQIANNTILGNISFPALQLVGGAIDFSGSFSTPNLPALKTVKGGFNVESFDAIDCTKFKAEASPSGVIQGKFFCQGNLSTVASLGTGTSSGSSPTSTGKKGGAVTYGISEAAAGLSVMAGLLQMLL